MLLVASGLAGAGISSLAAQDDNDWDVMAPPGNWREIPIDTTTTTWSFLDVSPDGKELVFDMLARLCRRKTHCI